MIINRWTTLRRLSISATADSQPQGYIQELPLSAKLTLSHAHIDSPVIKVTIKGISCVAQGPKLPIVSLALSVPAGCAFERQKTGDCDAGTNKAFSEQYMSRYFEENGVRISTDRTRLNTIIRADAPQGALADISKMIMSMVSTFRVKENELESIKTLAKIENSLAETDPDKLLMDLAYQAGYFNNPLGNPLRTPDGQLDRVTSEQVNQFAQNILDRAGHMFSGVGVDVSTFRTLLESFGYTVSNQKSKQKLNFKPASELYQADTFKYEHDRVALFWELGNGNVEEALLFKEYFDPTSKIPFGSGRGLLAAMSEFVAPFVDYELDHANQHAHGIYGLIFKTPRGQQNLDKQILKCLKIVADEKTNDDLLEFARLRLGQSMLEARASQYSRIKGISRSLPSFSTLSLPTTHCKSNPSMVVLGDIARLPKLGDII